MYYIVIRKQRDTDIPQISGVVRTAYASNITNMFYSSIFNEGTLQLIVILSAILFIFFHVRLTYCLFTIPVVLILIYLFIYGAVTMKSAQVMYDKKPLQAWVAEAYEPPFLTKEPKSCWYKIISEEEMQSLDAKPEGRKRIVGTIAVMKHFRQTEWAWLYRLVVDERYRRKGIALNLVKTTQEWCKDNQHNKLELSMTEHQEGARQLFDKTGFEIKQLYHKRIFTSAYMLQMYLLTSEVRPTFS